MATKTAKKPRAPYTGSTMPKGYAPDKKTAERNAEIINEWESRNDDGSRKWPNQTALAAHFGVSQTVVSMIVCNPNSTTYS